MLRAIIDEYLLANAGIAPEKLADPQLKMVDLGLDSLGVVEMIFEVEDRYGIHLEDVMQFQHMTLNEVVAHMEGIILEKHGGKWPTTTAASSVESTGS